MPESNVATSGSLVMLSDLFSSALERLILDFALLRASSEVTTIQILQKSWGDYPLSAKSRVACRHTEKWLAAQ
jgi:hypothetical protein